MVCDIQDIPRVQPCRLILMLFASKPSQVQRGAVHMHASDICCIVMNDPAMTCVSLLPIHLVESAIRDVHMHRADCEKSCQGHIALPEGVQQPDVR